MRRPLRRSSGRSAPMAIPAGACLFFHGTLLHRGGANRSAAPRLAFSNQYCQPWARTQENFYLGVPPERIAAMSPRLQILLGYDVMPPFMGHVTASHPLKTLRPGYVNALHADTTTRGDDPMRGLHPLDRTIGTEWPVLGSDADVRAFEATPFAERIAATNTYEALRLGAARDPDAAALLFLPNADPDETPAAVSHREFFGRVTQVANMLHGLGVGPGDVVSLLLPLLPQSFCALFGAEAAGHREPGQSAARGRTDRRHPARREDQGADRARPAAGHRHLEQGRTHPRTAAGPEGDRRRPRRGRRGERRPCIRRARRLRSPPIAWSAAG